MLTIDNGLNMPSIPHGYARAVHGGLFRGGRLEQCPEDFCNHILGVYYMVPRV